MLATRSEPGIDSIDPEQAARLRAHKQEASAATVGVSVVEFLDHPDGLVVNSLELRRDLTAAIRRHRPEVIIASKHWLRWSVHGPWNHVDHRELGTITERTAFSERAPGVIGHRTTGKCSALLGPKCSGRSCVGAGLSIGVRGRRQA